MMIPNSLFYPHVLIPITSDEITSMTDTNGLERFLELLADTKQYQQFKDRCYSHTFSLTKQPPLQFYLRNLPTYIFQALELSRDYHYSLEIEVFLSWLEDNDVPFDDIYFINFCKHPQIHKNPIALRVIPLLTDLHQRLTSPQLKSQIALQNKQANRTYKVMSGYIDRLFDIHAKLVAIRVDLGYQKYTRVTLEEFEKDLNHFFNNAKKNHLFRDLVGHITKIEFGLSKELHAHVLLIFNGQKRKGDSHVHIAQCIYEYWESIIPNGLGWNVNANRHEYEAKGTLGIGGIHFQQTDKIANLKKYVVEYLCRRKQFIKPKNKPKMKLIRRGDLPPAPEVKLGRRRYYYDNGGIRYNNEGDVLEEISF
jgi:hypothetical protein